MVTGRSTSERLETLAEVFNRLKRVGLKLKKQTCEFLLDEVEYLGCKINQHGISPSDAKVAAIQKAPNPTNKTQLRAFLGLVNYHKKHFSAFESSPTSGLQVKVGEMPPAAQAAFGLVKRKLAVTPCLDHFRPDKPFILAVDASPYGVGTVLMHRYGEDSARPTAYASRTLSKAKTDYSQLEKEALAIVWNKNFYMYPLVVSSHSHGPSTPVEDFGP